MIRITPWGGAKVLFSGVTGFNTPDYDIHDVREKIPPIGWAIVTALIASLIVAPATVLSWSETGYALLAGVISTLLPAGSLPLGNPGELVAMTAELVLALAEIAGVSQAGAVAVAVGMGGVALLGKYGGSG